MALHLIMKVSVIYTYVCVYINLMYNGHHRHMMREHDYYIFVICLCSKNSKMISLVVCLPMIYGKLEHTFFIFLFKHYLFIEDFTRLFSTR